ncbi:hypothetical protein shn_34695 (plasmid) [Shinella sp. HZN7]|nr:hypothetical protein shn_34695 [Shinella sp. HZN7]
MIWHDGQGACLFTKIGARSVYLAKCGGRCGGDHAGTAFLFALLRMLMPLLVRLNESQIEVKNGAVAKVVNRADDHRGILEQMLRLPAGI